LKIKEEKGILKRKKGKNDPLRFQLGFLFVSYLCRFGCGGRDKCQNEKEEKEKKKRSTKECDSVRAT
jgi:hypothetical protein